MYPATTVNPLNMDLKLNILLFIGQKFTIKTERAKAMTAEMSMKISILPDRTRIQTMKPSFDDMRIRCNIMYITQHRGCERGIVEFTRKTTQNLDDIWNQIHSAFVLSVCQLKQLPSSSVLHVTDRSGYLDGNTIKYLPALSPTPQAPRPFRLFNRP